jgi:signal transduction histidine kinase
MKTNSLLKSALTFFTECDHPLSLNSQFASDFIRAISNADELHDKQIAISLEYINLETSNWSIAACTDPEIPIYLAYSMNVGLTGWLFITGRRTPFYAPDKSHIPAGMNLVQQKAEKIESAFACLINVEGMSRACLCAFGRTPNCITHELVITLSKIVSLLEIFSKTKYHNYQISPSSEILERTSMLNVASASSIDQCIEELSEQLLKLGYRWSVYWQFDMKAQILRPYFASQYLRQKGLDSLKPLKLDEGFTGTAATLMNPISEGSVVDGAGKESGIRTPHNFIYSAIPLRSILAVPVRDQNRLHGVITILSDSENSFHEDDPSRIMQLADLAALKLRDVDDKKIGDIQRKARIEIMKGLTAADIPTAFWKRIRSVFTEIVAAGYAQLCHFYIERKSDPGCFSCKANVTGSILEGINEVLLSSNAIQEMINSASRGIQNVEDLKSAEIRAIFARAGMRRIYLEIFQADSDSRRQPKIATLFGFSAHTPHTWSLGNRNMQGSLEPIAYSIYETTCAILNTADASALTKRGHMLFAAETHEVRTPLTTLKHEAEAMDDLSPKNVDHRHKIIAKANELLMRTDNILYSANKLQVEKNKDINIEMFIQEIIMAMQNDHPNQSIRMLPHEKQDEVRYMVYGDERCLGLAFNNVIGNAIKFGNNLPIEVSLSFPKDENMEVQIEVKDRGIGIPETELKAIFQPRFQSEYRRRHSVIGSQIGLSITKDIIEQHNGMIWAKSKLKESTQFSIKLPVKPMARK